jgi:hypothetical protein
MSRFLLRGRGLTPERDLWVATGLVVDQLIEFVAEDLVEAEDPIPMVEAGDQADLVVFTPDLRVRLTLVGGRVVHG